MPMLDPARMTSKQCLDMALVSIRNAEWFRDGGQSGAMATSLDAARTLIKMARDRHGK